VWVVEVRGYGCRFWVCSQQALGSAGPLLSVGVSVSGFRVRAFGLGVGSFEKSVAPFRWSTGRRVGRGERFGLGGKGFGGLEEGGNDSPEDREEGAREAP